MASQISHIAYGEKFIDKYLKNLEIDRIKFFIGTLFPDIRYLGSISRELTHIEGVDPEKILKTENDFQKGLLVHNFVDIEREKALQNLGISNIIEYNGYVTSVAKFIEDEFTYPTVNNWQQYITLFDQVLPEETELVEIQIAEKWHGLLRGYFSQPPTFETIALFSQELQSFTPEVIAKAKEVYAEIKSNPQVMDIIRQTYFNTFN